MVSLSVWLRRLCQWRGFRRIFVSVLVLARLGWARNPRNGQVLVDVVVQRKVALRNGVGATRLVLVDHLMHVRTKDMLGVLVDILVVNLLTDDCGTARSAAAYTYARDQLQSRDDRHC